MGHKGRVHRGALGAVLPLLLPWREEVVIAMCSSPGACWRIAEVSHGGSEGKL